MTTTLTPDQHTQLVALARAHAAADEYRSGHYEWRDGGACSIGCTIHDGKKLGVLPHDVAHSDHAALGALLGVEPIVPRLADMIFERLMSTRQRTLAVAWTERWLAACAPGSDRTLAWPKFAVWLMDDVSTRVGAGDEPWRVRVRESVSGLRTLYARWVETGAKPSHEEFASAAAAADAAWRAAAAAAWRATYAATATDAAAADAAAADARDEFWTRAADALIASLAARAASGATPPAPPSPARN